ncbi:MAG: DNA-binding protein, partial [Poseidonia sp.]
HTDDLLLEFAKEHQAATLTVDTELKRRLFEANLRVLEVKQAKYLHLVDLL